MLDWNQYREQIAEGDKRSRDALSRFRAVGRYRWKYHFILK
jgi:hypothetical protein